MVLLIILTLFINGDTNPNLGTLDNSVLGTTAKKLSNNTHEISNELNETLKRIELEEVKKITKVEKNGKRI